MIAAAGAAGIVVGWVLRSGLDRAMLKIVTRTLTSAVGRERVAEMMTVTIAKIRSGEDKA